MKRVLKKCVWIIVLVAVFATGICYAFTRDLYKGNNQTYVDPDAATGQIACVETVVQAFVPGHDFDGISLLLDHNRMADLGAVSVSVYRTSDDSCVMERTLPVAVTTRERYTYFASKDTIVAEPGEVFYAEVAYRGPASGLVTIANGEMPVEVADSYEVAGVAAGASLALGVVTDYQYDLCNSWMMVAADILFVVAVGTLVFCHGAIRKNVRKGQLAFLLGYLGIITSLFLLSLTMAGVRVYTRYPLGEEIEHSITLRDDGAIDACVTLPDDHVCGIQFPVELPPYSWMGETLTAQVRMSGSNQLLQTSVYGMDDIQNGTVYVQLHDAYPAGTDLILHLTTQGMVYEESIRIRTTSNDGTSNVIYSAGVLQEGQLFGEIQSSALTYSYTRQIQFYIVSLCVGVIMAWVMFRKGRTTLPAAGARATQAVSLAPRAMVGRRQVAAWFSITLLACVLMINFTWSEGLRNTQDKVTAELVSYATDLHHEWTPIPVDQEMIQSFIAGDEPISGVGLILSDGIEDEDASIQDAVIHVSITDAEGNELDTVSYAIAELTHIGDLFADSYTNGSVTDRGDLFYYIPFHEELHAEAGTELTIHVSAEQSGGNLLLIAENYYDEFHLMTVHRGYQSLIQCYWAYMTVMLIVVGVMTALVVRPMISPLTSALVMAIICGVIFSMLIPPFCVPDERAHIQTIYYLSNQLTGVYDAAGAGRIPVRASDVSTFYNSLELIRVDRYQDMLSGLFQRQVDNGNYVASIYQNTLSAASIWTYIPALLGFQTVRLLGFSCMTGIMMGRWCNLVAALIMIYYGIKRCPYGRNGLMMVMLFPQLLQQIASCSYDSMIIAYSFLFVGNAMHLIEDSDCSAWDYGVTLLAALLACSNKHGAYYVLLCVLLMPVLRWLYHHKGQRWITRGIIGAVAICVILIPRVAAMMGVGSSARYSLADILRDPVGILNLLEHTWFSQGDRYLVNTIGSGLGPREVIVPTYLVLGIGILWYLSWRNDRESNRRIGKRTGRYLVFLGVLGMIAICMGFVIAMTHHGDTLIQGIQGRYFLPYVSLLSIGMPAIIPEGHRILQQRILYGMSLILMLIIGIVFVSIFGIENVDVI